MTQVPSTPDKPSASGAASDAPATKKVIQPSKGEIITSTATGNSFTFGDKIGEGNFGIVYSCTDIWNNDLAAKVLKPIKTYEEVKASATAEFVKLMQLRHPYVTFVFDAFEFRDTFYIITERCYCPLTALLLDKGIKSSELILPIARCLLQAMHYLHINSYVHQDIHAGNVFAAFIKDEILPKDHQALQFKLGDLGVAKFISELDATNTRAAWMVPPEVMNPAEFGPINSRIDIYHAGLLFLQLANSTELKFTREDILKGRPRELALSLPMPYRHALEKALRRHVIHRTENAMELWRDLHVPSEPEAKTK